MKRDMELIRKLMIAVEENMQRLAAKLKEPFAEAARLEKAIRKNPGGTRIWLAVGRPPNQSTCSIAW